MAKSKVLKRSAVLEPDSPQAIARLFAVLTPYATPAGALLRAKTTGVAAEQLTNQLYRAGAGLLRIDRLPPRKASAWRPVPTSESSQAFEELLGLRTDVEQAIEKALIKSGESSPQPTAVELGKPLPAATKPAAEPTASTANAKAKERPRTPATEEADAIVVLDFENCMEQVWEQLIATPPSRGRSMTTVKIGGARILMSSWEVTAFVSEDGPSAEDLRRAVVARALVTAATESAKESGNATSLDRAMNIARVEVTRLQERVDVAKRAKDTEAAVNLGISTKRLLSALDEAEKL